MNKSAEQINKYEILLDDARKMHRTIVTKFISDLAKAKSKLRDSEIQNGACFYTTMREGRFIKNEGKKFEKRDLISIIEALRIFILYLLYFVFHKNTLPTHVNVQLAAQIFKHHFCSLT